MQLTCNSFPVAKPKEKQMTIATSPVHLPAGAVRAEDWQPERYRVFEGEQRYINESTSVWMDPRPATPDGSIDHGTRRESLGMSQR